MRTDKEKGLYRKFEGIIRTDGQSARGEKHDGCDYFVLDLTHDPHALPALRAYRDSCAEDFPELSADLDDKCIQMFAISKGVDPDSDYDGPDTTLSGDPR